jgi:N-carbamoyl-L-amino-acid hydrolase
MQDHAGGTTMAERRDAGLSAVRLLAEIDRQFPLVCGPRSTWTTGRITLDPGANSIIPGRAEVMFQLRDIDEAVIARMEACLRALVQESNRREKCPCVMEPVSLSTPALCDAAMQQALADAAEALAPGKWQRMPSGAGHDAQYLARKMPAAMLFTPSIGGISHHWSEDTKEEDLALARAVRDPVARAIPSDSVLANWETACAGDPPWVTASATIQQAPTFRRIGPSLGVTDNDSRIDAKGSGDARQRVETFDAESTQARDD